MAYIDTAVTRLITCRHAGLVSASHGKRDPETSSGGQVTMLNTAMTQLQNGKGANLLVPIDEIKIRHRVRKDLGDIDSLKESIKRIGLLNPIIINAKNELIAGMRRLSAAKELGWQNIPATVVNITDRKKMLEIELLENMQRVDFSDKELLAGYKLLQKKRNPCFLRVLFLRIASFFARIFKRT